MSHIRNPRNRPTTQETNPKPRAQKTSYCKIAKLIPTYSKNSKALESLVHSFLEKKLDENSKKTYGTQLQNILLDMEAKGEIALYGELIKRLFLNKALDMKCADAIPKIRILVSLLYTLDRKSLKKITKSSFGVSKDHTRVILNDLLKLLHARKCNIDFNTVFELSSILNDSVETQSPFIQVLLTHLKDFFQSKIIPASHFLKTISNIYFSGLISKEEVLKQLQEVLNEKISSKEDLNKYFEKNLLEIQKLHSKCVLSRIKKFVQQTCDKLSLTIFAKEIPVAEQKSVQVLEEKKPSSNTTNKTLVSKDFPTNRLNTLFSRLDLDSQTSFPALDVYLEELKLGVSRNRPQQP